MTFVTNGDLSLHYVEEGDKTGPTVVFAHSLGTDLIVWDSVIERLPDDLHILRLDIRGHGKSDAPDGPYKIGQLIRDTEIVLDNAGVRDCVFVGLSVGGIIAQGLATKRMDLIRAMVLSNSAAKSGTPDMWRDRAAKVLQFGLESIVDDVMERWFSKSFRNGPDFADQKSAFLKNSPIGYAGTCLAIGGADFITPTSGLRLPTLAIAGSEDRALPADMVRETADLIPGSTFELIKGVGHIPCVENPDRFSQILIDFFDAVGHR